VLRAARLLAMAKPARGLPLVTPAIDAGLTRVFGPAPFNPAAYPGDPGLLGPDSASWRIIGEPAAIVGGLRALLIQVLHPLAMAGVADHSRFRSDPLGRLRRTSAYVVTSTFGATPEALAAATAVRAVHRRITGLAPDGRRYNAADPHLLVWVSIALTSSFLVTHRTYSPTRVDAAAEDAFVAEQSSIAALLDPRVDLDRVAAGKYVSRPLLENGLLPTDVEQLEATLASYEPELEVNAQGREALRFLLWPHVGLVRAGYLPVLASAIATLMPRQRELLGLPLVEPVAAALRWQSRVAALAARVAMSPSPSLLAARQRVAADAGLKIQRV
jgi:uncharacterized protein (DUF2236 family)